MMKLEEVINHKTAQEFGRQWSTHCCLAIGYLAASCVIWKIAMASEIYVLGMVAAVLWFLPFPLEVLRSSDCFSILSMSNKKYRGLDIRKQAPSNVLWEQYGETAFGAAWLLATAFAGMASVAFAQL